MRSIDGLVAWLSTLPANDVTSHRYDLLQFPFDLVLNAQYRSAVVCL
jgi:hypothetical protein